MDKILKEIVETDKALRLDVEKAKERRESLTAELAEKKISIDNEYKLNAEREIEKAKSEAAENISRISAEIQAETDKKSQILNKVFDEKHSEWETTILNSVLEK